ncbi:MAG: hypothetical protein JSS20_17555 [Proteobacteria bacterium]|nr:hypothetical protein [Pseudomonadota bacterium]
MLQSLFKRAEATVDSAIASFVTRTLIALPFLVGAGFATAAGSIWFVDQLGTVWGLAAIAGVYFAIGALAASVVAIRSERAASKRAEATMRAESQDGGPSSSMDRDMAMAALTAVAPVALQSATRLAFRNLPLVAAIGAAAFVLSRPQGTSSEMPVQPAE